MAEGDGGYSTVGEIRAWISGHEKLCADRAEATKSAIKDLVSMLKWGGGVAFAAIIGLMGWSLKTNWDTQQQQIDALRQTREAVTQSSQQVVQQVQQATGAAQLAGQPDPPRNGDRRLQ